jgi:type I restriction enzyme S subunit
MMKSRFKPYPTMKDSGLPWLGKIPEHWQLRRGKILFDPIDVRSATGEEELLTVSSEKGVVRRSSINVTMFKAESYVGYKLCWPGDLVVNSLWAWAKGLGVSRDHGIVSSAYGVYRLQAPYCEYSNYIHELVRSTPFQWELQVRSKGIWVSRLQLTDEAFLDAPFPLPPEAEQAAIVRFLDHIDRHIRGYIRVKQKLVKLLEEQRQAIIHRAVTRGLDPHIRLKASDVEWLGEVPEDWEIIRLGRLVNLITGFPFQSDGFTSNESDIKLLRGVNVSPGVIRWTDVVRWPQSERHNYEGFELQIGDIILGMDRPLIHGGTRVGMIQPSDLPALLLQRVARIRTHAELDADFLLLLLAGKAFAEYLTPIFTGITVPHLSPDQIKSFRFALPDIDEQAKVVTWVETNTRSLRQAMENTQREIALLREYQIRLIADMVTGKLDVREAATRLPDEPAEPELLDDIDAEFSPDTESTDALDETLETIGA